jgi:serine/threonine protein kinase
VGECPSGETLARWRAGTLEAAAREPVSTHVGGCARCAVLSDDAPAAPPRELAAGSRVGRFVVEARLGAGAMGVVHAARDPQLGRPVALKLLRGAATPSARARLLREAQAMARLAHPNVVVVHEAFEADEQVVVVMERVHGTSLDAHLARGERCWREVLELYLQAGRGLAAAHAAGIVHRDF